VAHDRALVKNPNRKTLGKLLLVAWVRAMFGEDKFIIMAALWVINEFTLVNQ